VAAGFLTKAEAGQLSEAFNLRQSLQQTLRLVSEGRFLPNEADMGVLNMIMERGGAADIAELEAKLTSTAQECAAIFEAKLTT